MKKFIKMVTICIWLISLIALYPKSAWSQEKPKLIVQITVDQFRGDFPTLFIDRLGEGGLRYLLDKGTHYTNAHYGYANTETAVGHATLFTGADPSTHGLVGNAWIDQATGDTVYNTEDDRHHLIGKDSKPHSGVSPKNILVSTIGDELINAKADQARVFSVSIKDRGAIIPGGHKGKAFWFSKSSGDFVTSTYYYDQYPKWVTDWNAAKPADRYKGTSWELLQELSTYEAKDRDDRPYEADVASLGITFPHPLGEDKHFYLRLTFTPMGDELTLDFAKTLIENEKVGQGETTDFLAVSFSVTDYIGHAFGPASLETEDNILRLDRTLAEFFKFIDQKVGLDNTLIVLSGDHGAPEAPEYSTTLGRKAGRFDFTYFRDQGPINAALKERFGRDDLIAIHSHPYLYLDLDAIEESKLDLKEVEDFVVSELVNIEGIALAETKSNLLSGSLKDGPIQKQIQRNFNPARSGHIHMVQDEFWFLHSTDEAAKMGLAGIAAIHGSPWSYDTHVPIFFSGPQVSAQTIDRRVEPNDIAVTIAQYLNIGNPSGANGSPLTEVLSK